MRDEKERREIMIVEYPDYYEQFHCIADRCPDTCCAGWEVDLDDETWYRYMVVPGAFGEKLRAHMRDDGEWKYFPLTEWGRCPFLKDDNLCEIYEKLGEDALCQTCAEHPRYFCECGSYEQRDLSLGCPEVARIFFSEEGAVRYCRRIEDEGAYEDTEELAASTGQICEVSGERTAGTEQICEASGERTASTGQMCEASGERIAGTGQICEVSGERTADWKQQIADGGNRAADGPEADPKLQRILDDRNRVLSTLQEGGDWRERLKTAGIWRPVNDRELLALVREMEPLNEDWSRRVREIEYGEGNRPRQNWMIRFACYLVFRYWIDAYYEEGDMEPQILLVNRSLRLLEMLYAADETPNERERMIRAAYVFSRQVEFDDVNVALMKRHAPASG